jgi:hypothetical protein
MPFLSSWCLRMAFMGTGVSGGYGAVSVRLYHHLGVSRLGFADRSACVFLSAGIIGEFLRKHS